jgi:HEAT repeat protein
MFNPRPVLWFGFVLALLPLGCNKSNQKSGSGSTTAAGLATNRQAAYDLSRLAAELKSTSPQRRTEAIQKAAELDEEGEDVIPTLLAALKDSTAGPLGKTSDRPDSTRETAVLALLGLKEKGKKALQDSGLKTLEQGLRNEKPNVREHTVNAIGMVGPDARQSAEAVAKLCADPEKEVRSAAYRALQKIKAVPPGPVLRLLMHRNAQVAVEAAAALEWLKPAGPESVQPLLDALKRQPTDKEEPSDITFIRNKAAEALAGIGKGADSAVPTLVEMITKTKSEDADKLFQPAKPGEGIGMPGPVLALRRIGQPAVAAVVPLLKSEEAVVRFQAAGVLSGMRKGDAAEALPQIQAAMEAERGLPGGQMIIFEELTAAFVNHGGDIEKITAGVIDLLKNDDEGVRFRAARMIARIGRKAAPAVPKLIELLNDPKATVQSAAIEALAAIGPDAKDAVIELAKKVEGDDVNLGREAARALRMFGPGAAPAVPALAKALDSNDQNMCIDAANTLAAIGPEAVSAVDSLAKHLIDENTRREERLALLQAIAAIGPPAKDAIPSVAKLLADKEIAVRVAAIETLGKIGGGNADAARKLAEQLKDLRNTPFAVQNAVLRALAGMGARAQSVAADVKAYQEQTKDSASKVWAAAALTAMGADADANARIVLTAIKDSAPTARTARGAAIEAAEYLGERARPGVPDLIEALKDRAVRDRAARTLGRLGAVARDAIPPLTDLLKDPDRAMRRAAAEALGAMGPEAVVAAPKLRELARTDAELAAVANAALDRIEPAKKDE